MTRAIVFLVSIAILAGCDRGETDLTPGTRASVIQGAVGYRERMALTRQAELEVRLIELTSTGGPAPVIGLIRITNPGQVPIPFRIPFDPELLDPDARYAIDAHIRDRHQTLFATPTPVLVLKDESDRTLELLLERSDIQSAIDAQRYDCHGTEPDWQARIDGERLRFQRFLEQPVHWVFEGRYRVQGEPGETSVVWHGVDRAKPVHRLTAWILEEACQADQGTANPGARYSVSITLPDVNVVRGCCRRPAPEQLARTTTESNHALADLELGPAANRPAFH